METDETTRSQMAAERAAAEAAALLAASQSAGDSAGTINATQESTMAAAAIQAQAATAPLAAHESYNDPYAKGTAKDTAAGEGSRWAATPLQMAKNAALPPDLDEWELSEGGLPAGTTLSGSKALLEDYPEDETTSKQTKKPSTGKGKRSSSKKKA
jgi:hypothetical protein